MSRLSTIRAEDHTDSHKIMILKTSKLEPACRIEEGVVSVIESMEIETLEVGIEVNALLIERDPIDAVEAMTHFRVLEARYHPLGTIQPISSLRKRS